MLMIICIRSSISRPLWSVKAKLETSDYQLKSLIIFTEKRYLSLNFIISWSQMSLYQQKNAENTETNKSKSFIWKLQCLKKQQLISAVVNQLFAYLAAAQ